jgi:hypothetical protein
MGTFGKSLGKELGKNTGKFVSNKVFGDKWSTPYRVSATVEVEKFKASQAKIQAEAEYDRIRQQERIELERNDREILLQISKVQFSLDKDEIYYNLTEMCSLLESYQDTKVKKGAKAKINDGLFKLKQINAVQEYEYFKNKLDDYEIKVKFRLYFIFFSLGLFLLGIILIQFFSGNKPLIGLIVGSVILIITSSIIYANKIGVNFNK